MSTDSLIRMASRGGVIWDGERSVALADLCASTALDASVDDVRGRTVIVTTGDQMTAAMALFELDGVARRIVLCPPDLKPGQLFSVATNAEADAIIIGRSDELIEEYRLPVHRCGLPRAPCRRDAVEVMETEWALLTSGTSGPPKLVAHSLASLCGALKSDVGRAKPIAWSTFYDIRRFGGLQIFLRAVASGGELVLSRPTEDDHAFFRQLALRGVTHVSGTPSHWRRAMMNAAIKGYRPGYVRLSGEVADQGLLDGLRETFPGATIAHAYASTEAGVAFEVDDGQEGFPAEFVGHADNGVEIRIVDGKMSIRSDRTARRYLGVNAPRLLDGDGFVTTPDAVEFRGGRWIFVGRSDGVVNVGGFKVHPEEVEAILNRHEYVRMSHVKGRHNPITGEIVVADVVLNNSDVDLQNRDRHATIREEILKMCRNNLPPHKVPATIRFVAALEISAGGKLVRHA